MQEPCVFVLFGGTGDLAKKKLVPALYRLHLKGKLDKSTCVISTGRKDITTEKLLVEYARHIDKKIFKKDVWQEFGKRFQYHLLEFSDDDAYNSLKARIMKLPARCRLNRIFYLATPQDEFGRIVEHLGRTGLGEREPRHGWHRVIIEKPFGSSRKSARALNKELCRLFTEEQIYRIDHYIGKTFVQEIFSIRFSNPIFENQWNNKFIEEVHICISETQGVETRGGYYDNSGAIRDMLQNHLLQLLSLIAMEPPENAKTEEIRDQKTAALRHIVIPSKHSLKKDLVVGQYTTNKKIPNYIDEKGVKKNSRTETFVALKLEINNKRWHGVPFYLWTGKALKEKYAEVNIKFKKGNWIPIPDTQGILHENVFTVSIQPNEGLRININLSAENQTFTSRPVTLDFTRPTQCGLNTTEAYELLISESILGNRVMFTRHDFVDLSWKIVDEIRKNMTTLHKYKAGSEGPFAALRLIGSHKSK